MFLVLGNLLSAQTDNYYRLSSTTYKNWIADMTWNGYTEEWDFVNRPEVNNLTIEWYFLIDKITGTGTIKAGTIAYDVQGYTTEVKDGVNLVHFRVYNPVVEKYMSLIYTQQNSDVFIAIYDNIGRTAYYFD